MVRGAAALLVAVAWFLLVGEVDQVTGDGGRYLAGCIGALACALAALSLLPGRDDPVGLAVFGAGAAFLAAVLAAQDVGAAANPVEALAAAAAAASTSTGLAAAPMSCPARTAARKAAPAPKTARPSGSSRAGSSDSAASPQASAPTQPAT